MTDKIPVFIHIPKTAGITLHSIIERQYTTARSFTAMHPVHLKLYTSLSPKKKQKIKLIKGHLHFGIHEHCPAPVQYFTMFRNPIDRAISHYNFLWKDNWEMKIKKYSLKETLQKGIGLNMDNCHVRYLCGETNIPYGGVNENHLQKAIENLRNNIAVVGITEQFDASVLLFTKRFKWKTPFYIKNNITPKKRASKQQLDEETLRLLEHYNRYDTVLYNTALEMFNEQVQQAGPTFTNEVASFTKTNQQRNLRNKIENYFSFIVFLLNHHNVRNVFFNTIRRFKMRLWLLYQVMIGQRKPISKQ